MINNNVCHCRSVSTCTCPMEDIAPPTLDTVTVETVTYGTMTLRPVGTRWAFYGTGPSGTYAGQVRVSLTYASVCEAVRSVTARGFVAMVS